MSQLRLDPLTGRWVVMSSSRGDRPQAFQSRWLPVWADPERPCPFCPGNEEATPPALETYGPSGQWLVRVVPNLYPALAGDGDDPTDPLSTARGEPDLFAARPARGAHELIVNAPEPVSSLLELDPGQVAEAMTVWRERMRAHGSAAYVHLIVNEGAEAGASLPHTHAQLYALPFVPASVARERERFTAYFEQTQGRNLLEDLVQEEVRRRERIVAVDAEAVAICPFASRVPFHVQVAPRRPAARFEDEGPLGAALVHQVFARLAAALGAVPPLNMWVRTAPRGAERFCWRIDLLPRLAQLAGLEVGTGVHLNVLPPERAAERLRAATDR
jgi:UDPglucose--hexose-1-phosphate uridylyltransferase